MVGSLKCTCSLWFSWESVQRVRRQAVTVRGLFPDHLAPDFADTLIAILENNQVKAQLIRSVLAERIKTARPGQVARLVQFLDTLAWLLRTLNKSERPPQQGYFEFSEKDWSDFMAGSKRLPQEARAAFQYDFSEKEWSELMTGFQRLPREVHAGFQPIVLGVPTVGSLFDLWSVFQDAWLDLSPG